MIKVRNLRLTQLNPIKLLAPISILLATLQAVTALYTHQHADPAHYIALTTRDDNPELTPRSNGNTSNLFGMVIKEPEPTMEQRPQLSLNLRVTGVILDSDKQLHSALVSIDGAATERVFVGETKDKIRFISISNEKLVYSYNGQENEVATPFAKTSSAPPPSALVSRHQRALELRNSAKQPQQNQEPSLADQLRQRMLLQHQKSENE